MALRRAAPYLPLACRQLTLNQRQQQQHTLHGLARGALALQLQQQQQQPGLGLGARCLLPARFHHALQSCCPARTAGYIGVYYASGTRLPTSMRGQAARLLSTTVTVPGKADGIVSFPLAQTGEGISECELLQWFIKEGDMVSEFDKLCEVQSDKATIEITSRYKGRIVQLHHSKGDIVKVGAMLVDIDTGTGGGGGTAPAGAVAAAPLPHTDPSAGPKSDAPTSETAAAHLTRGVAEEPAGTGAPGPSLRQQAANDDAAAGGKGAAPKSDGPVSETAAAHLAGGATHLRAHQSGGVSGARPGPAAGARMGNRDDKRMPGGIAVPAALDEESLAAAKSMMAQGKRLGAYGTPGEGLDRLDGAEVAARGVNEEAEVLLEGQAAAAAAAAAPSAEGGQGDRVLTSPAVRALAREHGVPLGAVQGSGRDGRILKEDVLSYLTSAVVSPGLQSAAEVAAAVAAAAAAVGPAALTAAASSKPQPSDPDPAGTAAPVATAAGGVLPLQAVPLRGFRRAMIKSMTAVASIPHFHYMDEVAVDALMAARAIMASDPSLQGAKLTLLPLLIKALSVALLDHPHVNASLAPSGTDLLLHPDHNIGVAMAAPGGLVVPNIKKVQTLTVMEVAAQLQRLQALAAANQLSSADVAGGTVSVSNIGSIGGIHATPLVNPPEVAIVALGRVRKLPRYNEAEQVIPRSLLPISWGADHRVVDGAGLARLSNTWKQLLEEPARLLLQLR